MTSLPRIISRVGVPPVKCQGIKTKLVPFIFRSVRWQPDERASWIEPFLGSGVVALNLAPKHAILADTNEHIIRLYRGIQSGEITPARVRAFLVEQGALLSAGGADYYYAVRDRFNRFSSTLDFIFLNRSCFNGVMRFNRKGEYNVPFGHKPERFSKAYISKIVNQVGWVACQMHGTNWQIRQDRWDRVLSEARPGDFAYADPPYIGRHTDYYNGWSENDARRLAMEATELPCGYAVSMWVENRHRRNAHIVECWSASALRTFAHFYHVGSTEDLRNEMEEGLLVHPDHVIAPGNEPVYVRSIDANLRLFESSRASSTETDVSEHTITKIG